MEKAEAVRGQLRCWDLLSEMRISLQKLLKQINRLPMKDKADQLISNDVDSHGEIKSKVKDSVKGLQDLEKILLTIQVEMLRRNRDTSVKFLRNEENEVPTVQTDTEELTEIMEVSEVDSGNEEEKDGESDAESYDQKDDESSGYEADDVEHSTEREKNLSLNIEKVDADDVKAIIKMYRNDNLKKWNEKTQRIAQKPNERLFNEFKVSILEQIEQIMNDKERLIRRTQLKRSHYDIIGEDCEAEDEHNEEIFDDDDFYHQLLREIIDNKSSGIKDPIELTRNWIELQKMRRKVKRKVDTKASKGKKIRYSVHPKLLNFMAPNDNSQMSESAVKELTSSLFSSSV